jgi:MFS family permease
LPAMILLFTLGKRIGNAVKELDEAVMKRPRRDELHQNLKQLSVLLILGVNLLLYLCYSTVFFFVKSFAAGIGSSDAGTFFTISTLMMIAVRLLGGTFFDKVNKVKVLGIFVLLLMVCFVLLCLAKSPGDLYLLAGFYGLCVGVILPLLNAAMFLVSPPRLRGLNTNLALFMMDAGFFLSPYLGGMLLAAGGSVRTMFMICTGFLALSLVFLILLGQQRAREQQESLSAS